MNRTGEPPAPDTGWPVRRLAAGALVGLIAGVQSQPFDWSVLAAVARHAWPVPWWLIATGLAMLGFAALIAYAEEQATARPQRWWVTAGQAVLLTLVMAFGFTLALLTLCVIFGGLLAGFVWLTYGIGPVRGAVAGAALAGLLVLIGRISDERAARQRTGRTRVAKTTIDDLGDLKGKKVLVRVDFNVPLDKKTGAVKNDRRIRGALPTVKRLLDAGAAVVAMSHLGRPEKATPDERKNLTMDKVAARFGELLGRPVKKAADEVVGPAVAAAAAALKPGEVLLLENLRFDPREQKNDPEFAAAVAALGDAYVNDAFGTCHNDKDASMVAVPAALKAAGKPRAVGLLVAKELEVIDGLMSKPKPPVVAIMGGAKVSDKINFINALLAKVDNLLIGGKMTYTFLKAKGVDVGGTKVADEELTAARPLLAQVGKKIVLAADYVAAKSDDLAQTQVCEGAIPAGYEGVDIGPKTIAAYAAAIKAAGTVIWNGPVGWFEQAAFARGTKEVAGAMAASAATTVVGGGETAEAVEQFGYDDKMTHVSTGGGAFLASVEGKTFQSLAQIDDK